MHQKKNPAFNLMEFSSPLSKTGSLTKARTVVFLMPFPRLPYPCSLKHSEGTSSTEDINLELVAARSRALFVAAPTAVSAFARTLTL